MARTFDDWTASLFIFAIAVLIIAGFAWELFVQKGKDPVVLSTLVFLTIIPLAGRAAVRIIKAVRE